jgi:hypothetical protein
VTLYVAASMNLHGTRPWYPLLFTRSCAFPSKLLPASLAVAVLLLSAANIKAEDGYRLWLRYDSVPKEMINAYRTRVTSVVVGGNSGGVQSEEPRVVKRIAAFSIFRLTH